MKRYTDAELKDLTLRQLLDAYADARVRKLADEMERLNREIDKRRAKGEMP
jgi:hypothetical protein